MTTVRKKRVVGFRFHPTDKELLSYFLRLKNQGLDCKVQDINVVDLCKFEPWDLPDQSNIRSDNEIWYFFCPRDFKYLKSERRKRTTEKGYWKPTGKPRHINSNKKQIGSKKTLVFHHGRPKGKRTNWVIHEYDFCASATNLQGHFVLCKLKRNSWNIGRNQTSSVEDECQIEVNTSVTAPPPITPSNFENQNLSEPSNLENQTNTSVTAPPPITPSNFENQNSIEPSNLEIQTLAPSNLENQTLIAPSNVEVFLSTSNLENQISRAPSNLESQICEAIPSATIAFNLENYRELVGESTHPTVVPQLPNLSSCWKDDCISMSDLENVPSPYGEGQFSPLPSPFDSYGKGECVMTSNSDNQNFAYGEGALSPMAIPFIYGYESPNEMGGLFISELCMHIPNFDSEGGDPLSFRESELDKVEVNRHDSEKLSSEEKTETPVTQDGASSSLKPTLSDFESQNTDEKSSPEEDDWNSLLSSFI
ncbi:hypothetical protein K2173_003429 [Erythroxylum novogranatense]|uniref:NAC domain-containing protein n=1 Tax=Erythroxylum novogranatense TaxID=1862640 RepID=A0AAV8S918_9ROSI|nr:hypothetical protein K2173_003429 [Erythroxylum novogranatense]